MGMAVSVVAKREIEDSNGECARASESACASVLIEQVISTNGMPLSRQLRMLIRVERSAVENKSGAILPRFAKRLHLS